MMIANGYRIARKNMMNMATTGYRQNEKKSTMWKSVNRSTGTIRIRGSKLEWITTIGFAVSI